RVQHICAPAALSPDGKLVAIGSREHAICLRDAVTGIDLHKFETNTRTGVIDFDAARCAVFSPDGSKLAAGDMTNRVHVWDTKTGKELHVSEPFPNWVNCLAFSPDGKTLAIGEWQTIVLVDAETGRALAPPQGHSTQVNTVDVSPDGKLIVTKSEDALILWDATTFAEIRRTPGKRRFAGFSRDGNLIFPGKGSLVEHSVSTDQPIR